MKKMNRILSLLLAMVMLFSSMLVPNNAWAKNATELSKVSAETIGSATFAALENNYLSADNMTERVAVQYDGTDVTKKTITYDEKYPFENLFDNSKDVKVDVNTQKSGQYVEYAKQSEAGKTDQKDSYLQFTFDLGGTLVPSQVLFAVSNTKYNQYRYDIYGSADEDTLYTNGKMATVTDTSKEHIQSLTTLTNATAIRYFGIRIYSYGGASAGDDTFRWAEFQLNGTGYQLGITARTEGSATFAALENNYLSADNMTERVAVQYDGTDVTKKTITYDEKYPFGNLFDNSKDVKVDVNTQKSGQYVEYAKQSEAGKTDQKDSYLQFTFDLGGTLVPSQVLFAVSNTKYNQYRYDIYGSADEDTLYTNGKIATVTDTSKEHIQSLTTLTDATAIRYFGIRIYSYGGASAGDDTFRWAEFQLNGTGYQVGITARTEGSATFAALEHNYLSADKMIERVAVQYDGTASTTKTITCDEKYPFENLFDNSKDVKADVNTQKSGQYVEYSKQSEGGKTDQKDSYLQFTFDLGGTLVPSQVLFAVSNTKYNQYRYDIYGSAEKDTLYTNGKMATVTDTSKEHIQSLTTLTNTTAIRYFGIRIYSYGGASAGDNTFRWAEFQLNGTDYFSDKYVYEQNTPFTTNDLPSGDSLIKGKDATVYQYGAVTQTKYSYQFTFDLGKLGVPTKALVGNCRTNFQVKHYAIFGSENEADLYQRENCLAEVYSTKEDTIQTVTTMNHASPIRYYGIQIYSYKGNSEAESTMRLGELQLAIDESTQQQGEYSANSVESKDFTSLDTNCLNADKLVSLVAVLPSDAEGNVTEATARCGNNTTVNKLFDSTNDPASGKADIMVSGTYNEKTGGYYLEYVSQKKSVESSSLVATAPVTNGVIETAINIPAYAEVSFGAPAYIDAQFDSDTRIVYQLDATDLYTISSFVLSSVNESNPDFWLSKYVVYASDTKSSLFDNTNIIFRYDSVTGDDKKAHTVVANFTEEITARYVAVRILTPYTWMEEHGSYATRICEIGFYGDYYDAYKVPIGERFYLEGEAFTTDNVHDLGDSLIHNAFPTTVKYNGVAAEEWTPKNKKTFFGNITNGLIENESNHTTYFNETDVLDMIYTIDEDNPYDISGFLFSGHMNRATGSDYFIGDYEVYAAEDYDDLFLKENMIFDYNWEIDTPTDTPAHTAVVGFEEGAVRACYVAVRIKKRSTVSTTSSLVRICEIAFYGEKATIIAQPTNLTQYMPINAYYVANNGMISNVPDEDFAVDEVAKLSDNDRNTVVTLKCNGKRTDFFIDLCQEANISEIQVFFEQSEVPEYRIYATTDYASAWNESSLIYTYDGQNDGIRFANGTAAMRYVRISISAGQEEFALSDIQVIGLDNQLLKNKHISRSLSTTDVQFYTMNVSDKKPNYMTVDDAALYYDAETSVAGVISGTVAGQTTWNMLMNLGNLRCINSISLSYVERFTRLLPTEVNIYYGEIKEEVFGENVVPKHTFKGLPENGMQMLELIPTLARYVRIEFVKNNWDASWSEEQIEQYGADFINKENMNIALTEVDICGTSVVGLQTEQDKDTLLHFEDATTGIEWDIVRIDRNDIIRSVYSSKLVTYSATKAQKQSLASTLFKIDEDKLYGIEFYDVLGNQITDIQGRDVRIYFPASAELLAYNSMVGNVVSETKIDLCEINLYEDAISADIKYSTDMRVAFTILTNEDDPYWNDIGLGNTTEGMDNVANNNASSSISPTDSSNTSNVDDETTVTNTDVATKETITTTKTITTKATPAWQWILLVAQSVILIACIGTFVWMQFVMPRKKKQEILENIEEAS